ncbi:MAG: hypothetical protein AAFN68_11720, partial [Pseudomonadota bacterium]
SPPPPTCRRETPGENPNQLYRINALTQNQKPISVEDFLPDNVAFLRRKLHPDPSAISKTSANTPLRGTFSPPKSHFALHTLQSGTRFEVSTPNQHLP